MVASPLSSQQLSSPPLSSSPSLASPPKLMVPPNPVSDPSIHSSKDQLAEVPVTNALARPDLSLSSPSVLDPKFVWVAPPELILNCAMESLMPSPGRFMENSSESPRYSLSEQFFNGEMENEVAMVKNSELATVSAPSPPSDSANEQPEMLKPVENTIAIPKELAKANGKQVNIIGNSSRQAANLPPSIAGNGSGSILSTAIQPLSHKPPQGAWASPFKIAALFPALEKTAPSGLTGRGDVQSSIVQSSIVSGNEQWPSLDASKQTTRKKAQVSVKLSGETHASPISQDVFEASQEYPWAAKMKAVCNLRRVTTPVYMEDGTPKVSIPSHVLLEGIENQNQFVVGQFYRCKAPAGGLIHAVATRIWGRKCRIFTRKLGESSYLFHIPDEATRKWVIQRGIWHIDDCLMFVSPWSPSPTISLPEISTIPVWLTLQNIPYQLYSIKGIDWIASGIGEPMLTSKPWLDPTQMGEAKILVEVKLNKPFPQRVALEDKSGSITMVNVLYSWLPSKCSCCGQLGHKASHCLGIYNEASNHAKENGTISSDAQKPVDGHVPPQADLSTPVEIIYATETTPILGTPSNDQKRNPGITSDHASHHDQTLQLVVAETSPPATEIVVTSLPQSHMLQAPTLEASPLQLACSNDKYQAKSTTPMQDDFVVPETAKLSTITSHVPSPSLIRPSVENEQGNSPQQSSLTSPLHISRETSTCLSDINEEDCLGEMNDQTDPYNEDLSSQWSRGGRQIKPTQKLQEMLWTKAGGRGKRGRRGRGGGS